MIGLDGTAAAGRRSEAATTVLMQRPVLISAATLWSTTSRTLLSALPGSLQHTSVLNRIGRVH